MSLVDDYRKASGRLPRNTEKLAKSFVPSPESEDYLRGFIFRYFAKPSSDSNAPIIEIDQSQFNSHSVLGRGLDKNLYNVISVRWKISGTLEEVQTSNASSVRFAERKMRGIEYKLSNLLQFWREI